MKVDKYIVVKNESTRKYLAKLGEDLFWVYSVKNALQFANEEEAKEMIAINIEDFDLFHMTLVTIYSKKK